MNFLVGAIEILWHVAKARGNLSSGLLRIFERRKCTTLQLSAGICKIVFTADPEIAHKVLVDGPDDFLKTRWEERVLKPVMEDGSIILQGDEWKNRRRAVAQTFTPQHLQRLAPLVSTAVRKRLEGWTKAVNLSHEMRCVVNDVIHQYFLDAELGPNVDQTARAFGRIEVGLEDRVLMAHPPRSGLCFRESLDQISSFIEKSADKKCPYHSALSLLD